MKHKENSILVRTVIFVFSILLVACVNGLRKGSPDSNSEHVASDSTEALLVIKDIETPLYDSMLNESNDKGVTFILSVFNWYKNNSPMVNRCELVPSACTSDTTTYSVNSEALESTVSNIENCRLFSDRYIENLREHLEKVASELDKSPQIDGEIEGLVVDYFLKDSDSREIVNNMDNKKITWLSSTEGSAEYKVEDHSFSRIFVLQQDKKTGSYLIDSIK